MNVSGATNSTNVAALFHANDETLVNACVEYEKSLYSNIDLSGMLQGATAHGEVHININTGK